MYLDRIPREKKAPPPPTEWPVKAYKNLAYLTGPHARSLRVQCELMEPEHRFEAENIRNTLVFFGSARITDPAVAQERLAKAQDAVESAPNPTPKQEEELRIAKRLLKAAPYYTQAVQLAHDMTAWSNTLEDDGRFHIISGGGPGMMEAANRGAAEAGGKSIGLGISLPFEQGNNEYITDELNFEFHYFFVRKYWLFYLAKGLVVFPGGFGTMDELFEMLTLIQTEKSQKHVPIILYGKDFWNSFLNFEALIDWGVISEKDLKLFHICDSVEEARDLLIRELTEYYL